ncbi:hypothetical protein B0H63DRAFT_119495 [Podospora didyma]|uniref:NECAP PHear domain-containing protein n=1 Tax=Podospora didyma TaxID=330526 RepID=A0AAE0U4D0_9PEZI|nr:hypothetical protein B0H63DRAFT_119495 [Podospora didyma]
MEPTIDPATGRALPADAIQRILHIARAVHVYNIPPLSSTRGHTAVNWTDDPKRHIFTCRARIIETSIPAPFVDSATSPTSASSNAADKVKVDVVLEDASTGQLFAAAPYTSRSVVEPAIDSSRFFALRVTDPSGSRKAMLGIGFEERSEAFDFSIALQEAQKALGIYSSSTAETAERTGGGPKHAASSKPVKEEGKKDYSLKDGETITVNLSGTNFGRRAARVNSVNEDQKPTSLSSFALPPPPPPPAPAAARGGFSNSFLPPPPTAQEVRAQKRLSAQQLGFDDGKFGEFA